MVGLEVWKLKNTEFSRKIKTTDWCIKGTESTFQYRHKNLCSFSWAQDFSSRMFFRCPLDVPWCPLVLIYRIFSGQIKVNNRRRPKGNTVFKVTNGNRCVFKKVFNRDSTHYLKRNLILLNFSFPKTISTKLLKTLNLF